MTKLFEHRHLASSLVALVAGFIGWQGSGVPADAQTQDRPAQVQRDDRAPARARDIARDPGDRRTDDPRQAVQRRDIDRDRYDADRRVRSQDQYRDDRYVDDRYVDDRYTEDRYYGDRAQDDRVRRDPDFERAPYRDAPDTDLRRFDDRPRRTGPLRDRIRLRLDEARQDPEQFRRRVDTIVDAVPRIVGALDQVAGPDRGALDVPDRPRLGVTLDTVDQNRVIVADVQPGSVADRSGIRPGDELLLIDGRRVSSHQLLLRYLDGINPEQTSEIVVRRGDREFEVEADFSAYYQDRARYNGEAYRPEDARRFDPQR